MSGDEDDYMSDDFLTKCIGGSDVRPGLISTAKQQREHEQAKKRSANFEEMQKHKKIRKTVEKLEVEKRDEGLAKSIAEPSNKGFALLAKMGYKIGQSLGRDNTGRLEPVEVDLKIGRAGLGRETALKQMAEHKVRILEQRSKEIVAGFDPLVFRAQMRKKHEAARTDTDLMKAQISCRDLDQKKELSAPAEPWLWPPVIKPRNEEEEEEEEEEAEVFTGEEKLSMVVTYLRISYSYCLYCGIQYDNNEDLTVACPGPSREEHNQI